MCQEDVLARAEAEGDWASATLRGFQPLYFLGTRGPHHFQGGPQVVRVILEFLVGEFPFRWPAIQEVLMLAFGD